MPEFGRPDKFQMYIHIFLSSSVGKYSTAYNLRILSLKADSGSIGGGHVRYMTSSASAFVIIHRVKGGEGYGVSIYCYFIQLHRSKPSMSESLL